MVPSKADGFSWQLPIKGPCAPRTPAAAIPIANSLANHSTAVPRYRSQDAEERGGSTTVLEMSWMAVQHILHSRVQVPRLGNRSSADELKGTGNTANNVLGQRQSTVS